MAVSLVVAAVSAATAAASGGGDVDCGRGGGGGGGVWSFPGGARARLPEAVRRIRVGVTELSRPLGATTSSGTSGLASFQWSVGVSGPGVGQWRPPFLDMPVDEVW